MLEPLGMGGVESAVYMQVISEPSSTAAEVAGGLGMAPGRVRGALACLLEAGLITLVSGRPVRYFPAPPDVAVDALVRRRQEELEQVRAQASALAHRMREAPRSRGSNLVELVEGEQAVVEHVLRLQLGARQEVLIVDCPPYLYRPAPGNPQEAQSMRRGVAYRAIYHAPILDEPGRMDDLLANIAAGEQARVLPAIRMKMVIADGRQALIPVSFDAVELSSLILVHASPLLTALVTSFEHLWNKAVPLSGAQDEGGPGKSDRDMLTMLAAGMKDRAIARALGITERSVTRRVAHLLNTLGAETRFQAALRAAKLGWL
ncbi:LuxR C-terminal-related transcriptional regulator [Streptomyces sp. A3M-1-3]|uniref:helix-turn-helix transcriptional regulator n=1 Tax=Streptomyces sp. A3M-1-3 TaxID=2962044 RepID=UPI0020B69318|nr:helix-turn-helix domain-containing protein [Streptomyces sp. A3M-1-3]MCP3820396.1 LuxR C-terminal-related transcriptional regulator [Streptomyces sp. A3M-1-3]